MVRRNLHRSVEFEEKGGEGNGPRYCPSIERKLKMFPDKPSHNVWLEPEGLDSEVIYPNGLSCGLPFNAQVEFVRSVPGLEQAEILKPAYQVEYEVIQPQKVIKHTLETK